MKIATFALFFALLLIQCTHSSNVALIDRPLNDVYGGGYFNQMMGSRNLSYDLYGTHPSATNLQTLYNSLNNYNLIIFANNAGRDSTIHSIVSNSANQTALINWLMAGGQIFLNVYDDAGNGTSFLNLPGLSFAITDNGATSYTKINDDPLFYLPNEITTALLKVPAWEPLISFPTSATEKTILIARDTYTTMASFRYGLGRVVFLGQPIKTLHSSWPGMDDITPGTGALFLENVVAQMSVPVPEFQTITLLVMGSLLLYGMVIKK